MTKLPLKPTMSELKKFIVDSELEFAVVSFVDFQGTVRGKYVSRTKLESALDNMSIPILTMALDPTDAILYAPIVADVAEGYPDRPIKLLPETARLIPWAPERRNLMIMSQMAGDAVEYCTRTIFNRVVERSEALGYRPCVATELEFTLFNETARSIIDKGHRNLQPATPNKTYYSLVRQEVQSDIYNKIMDMCLGLQIPIESLHEEMGDGFMEVAVRYGHDATVPDAAALFRTFAKVVAQQNGQVATFMARWSNQADGQSGHIHASMQKLDGTPVFYDAADPNKISAQMRHFIGGMQLLMGDFMLMFAPNINSYKRLVPGIFAPVSAAWGIENRTCAIRAIPGSAKSSRIECRTPGADANPYLSLAAVITAGLHGIENRIEPTEPFAGNVYAVEIPEALRLPTSFAESIARFRGSAYARKYFGDAFVNAYADTRKTQLEQFSALVTDRELERFFELV
ncbi:glutamine synthetase family protein [Mesorhizobium sp. 2RAF21]|uniref:glutamine synthetase family protein n=1 Tax=Mesorhizobium sp. 2RAF21 TaxID=3232995 RepID=UPI003F9D8074